MASARVKIELIGASEVMRTVRGVRRETDVAAAAEKKALAETAKAAKKAEQEKIRAADRAAAAEKRAAEQTAKARTKAEQDASKAAQREAEKQRREADRLAQHWAKLAQKSADSRMRAEEQVTRKAAQEARKRLEDERRSVKAREDAARRTIRGAGGAVGSLVGGTIAGAAMAGSTARGITGVDNAATRVQKANDFRQRLIVTAANAGLNEQETSTLQSNVTGVAQKYAVDPSVILEGLQDAHDRFNALRVVAKHLDALVKTGKATDTDFRDIVGTVGSARESYGIDDLETAANLLTSAGQTGALNFKSFSGVMAPQMGIHALNTQQTGMEGLRQFIGVMQTVGAGQFGAEGAATRGSQAVSYLNREEVANDLKAIGVTVRGKDGKIDMGSVIDQLATNKKFQTPTQQSAIFHDAQAREGIQTLINQRNKAAAGKDSVSFASMRAVDAGGGADITNEVMRRLEGSGILDLQRQAIDMQNDTIKHLKGYNDQILSVTEATNAFEKAMGTFSLWAGAIGGGAAVTGGIGLATKLLGGGGAAAGGAAAAGATGAGVLATLGTGVAAVGAGTLAAGVGIAAGTGALAGYALNEGSEALTGKSISDRIAGWFIDDVKRQEQRGMGQAVEGEIKVNVDVKDDRVHVTTGVTKSRGARVSTSAGPNMGGAL
jgi:hypothetical protein